MRLSPLRALALIALLGATTSVEQTEKALSDLAGAQAALEKATTPESRLEALSEALLSYEKALSTLRDNARRLDKSGRDLRARLEAEQERVGAILMSLNALRELSEGLDLVHPGGVLERARAHLIVESLTPELVARASRLAQDLGDLVILRQAHQRSGDAVKGGLVQVRWAREQLVADLRDEGSTQSAPDGAAGDLAMQEALSTLAANVRSIDLLIEGIAALNPAVIDLQPPDLDGMFGHLPLPVDGILVNGFGQADTFGATSQGANVMTQAKSLVRAPFDATVRFVGPFLGYGNVIILEPAPDILMVLAGIEEVYVGSDQIVRLGEVVGMMGGEETTEEEALLPFGQQALYVEIRRGGSAVDPGGWFAQTREDEE